MKIKYFLIFIYLLCGCTTSQWLETVATETPWPTLNPEQELLLDNINTSYSAGIHAGEFSCKKCHATGDRPMEIHLAWADESTGRVEIISSPNELCGKCHADQVITAGTPETTQLAHVDFECTNCHNAHNLKAGCSESGCHADIQNIISAQVEKPSSHSGVGDVDSFMCGGSACHILAKQVANNPVYHRPIHRNVPCYVCHDISGLTVLMEGEQSWMTVFDNGQGDGAELLPRISHTIGLEVQCKKCHYANNPWTLDAIPPEN
jgi:hypothetical protein